MSCSLLACAQTAKPALDASLSPKAMLEEGQRYMIAAGRPASPELACDYFQRAADLGETEGLTLLGDCYNLGIGRQQNFTQAYEIFQRGIAAGAATSLCSLGVMQVAGRGVPKDEAGGVALCRQGAEKGVAVAQVALANYYRKGVGVPLSYKEAEFWLQKAVAQNSGLAEAMMGDMAEAGEGRPANMDEALSWWRKSAQHGSWSGMLRLANHYAKRAVVMEGEKRSVKPSYLVESFFWAVVAKAVAPPDTQLQQSITTLRDLAGVLIAGTLPNGKELIEQRAAAGVNAPPPADSEPVPVKTGAERLRQA
ncbi:sel1 repeat family protein [Acetobacteraceae bacterium H6797]|nr:sel1 repeat family protein [Acetobacteraceae bacterium H6797]